MLSSVEHENCFLTEGQFTGSIYTPVTEDRCTNNIPIPLNIEKNSIKHSK